MGPHVGRHGGGLGESSVTNWAPEKFGSVRNRKDFTGLRYIGQYNLVLSLDVLRALFAA